MEILLRHDTNHPEKIYLHKSIYMLLPHSGPVNILAGYESDGNSTPRGLWNIIPPFKYPMAFLFHDFLCGEAETPEQRKAADLDYKWILENVYKCKALSRLGYIGVRAGSFLAGKV